MSSLTVSSASSFITSSGPLASFFENELIFFKPIRFVNDFCFVNPLSAPGAGFDDSTSPIDIRRRELMSSESPVPSCKMAVFPLRMQKPWKVNVGNFRLELSRAP